MNNSSILTTTFCRKCKKLRSCLETKSNSNYKFLCKECAKEEDLISNCISCGREGVASELLKHGGYCHLCEKDNITECSLCGAEAYNSNLIDGVCPKCANGTNKPCIKCGEYFKRNGSYGHLPTKCYKDTCKIEIIKCNDHAQTVALEQYLIDKYLPKYNISDKRKDIFNPSKFENKDLYENMEKWKLYYTFREFDKNKIVMTRKQNVLSLIITALFFFGIIIYLILGFLR